MSDGHERVLSFEEALAVVLVEARGLAVEHGVERVALAEADGRVLAAAVRAERDQPGFDRSTRDGFAVRAGDVGTRRVVGSLRAGEVWRGALVGAGEAVEIMTGAPVPAGADAVVMVEHVSFREGWVSVEGGRVLRAGENVVARGAEARAGDSLLPVGRVMGAAEIAVTASCGLAEVEVFARPVVAVVATGDELVEVPAVVDPTHPQSARMDGAPRVLAGAEIWNSNGYALAALVRGEGGVARRLAIARDNVEDLRTRIEEGHEADLVLLSGGVSMGKHDLVERVLLEMGAEFFFTGAMIQPGKPVVFGRLPRRTGAGAKAHFEISSQQGPEGPFSLRKDEGTEWIYFFGLPGNPISTQVCFHLFVVPILRAMAGRTVIEPGFVEARLAEEVKSGALKSNGVVRFLPAELVSAWDGVSVRVVGWQGSGDVAANARGNCYCVLPVGPEVFRAGETVRVLLR